MRVTRGFEGFDGKVNVGCRASWVVMGFEVTFEATRAQACVCRMAADGAWMKLMKLMSCSG